MSIMTRLWGLGFVTVTVLSAHAQPSAVLEGYDVPRFAVPHTERVPQLDGRIEPNEWQGALQINLLQQLGSRQVSAMQTTWMLMWDEDHLYIAMRSPLRPGERLIQSQRRLDRDYNVVWDDSYEVWLDAGTNSPDGQRVFFQLLSNFAGARYDCLFEPAVGNSRLGWTSRWNPANTISADGSAWEMELAVPRASIFAESFADGQELRVLLGRNFKRPWLQNSITGQSDFSSRDAYARFTLSRTAPALHITAVGDPEANTFGLALSAAGDAPGSLRWSFAAETGQAAEGQLEFVADAPAHIAPKLDLAPASPKDAFRIRVTTPDGKLVLADWSAKLNYAALEHYRKPINDTGDQARLSATLNPVADYVRITGDFIQYDSRDRIDHILARVQNESGNEVASTRLMLDDLAYAGGTIPLPGLQTGDYRITLTAHDAAGQVLLEKQTQVKKLDHSREFAWWNTTRGNKDRVLPPWTPVTWSDGAFGVWGRTMTVGAAGLPDQITTQGRPLLARPAELVVETADGRTVTASAAGHQPQSVADHRAVVTGDAAVDQIDVTSRVTVEYDGVYKVELTLTPKQPVDIKSLRVVLPLRPEEAQYVHGSGEGIRYGFDARFIPESGRGRLWDSRRVDGQPMLVGSFIPFVWVGAPGGGLAWFADSDEGWFPSDHHPAIEVRRDRDDSTDLVLNLASEPVRLEGPRRIVFGLQATPVKPLAPRWRDNKWKFDATFHDFAGLTTLPGGQHLDLIWKSVPYVIDEAYAKKKAADWKRTRGMAVPYFEQNTMGTHRPEPVYFGEQWKASVGNTLWFEKTLQDFIIHSLVDWVEIADIDGWYVDNVRPEACANLEAGRGYRLPDGRVQPTFQIFEQRDYWLRVRAAFIEAGKEPPMLVLHMTHNMVIPWIGAAELALDHEANVIFPEMNKTFMDVWSRERLRLDYPAQWGTAIISMAKYDGSWSKSPPEVIERNWRSFIGANRLHDTLVEKYNEKDRDIRNAFGFGEPDVTFVGYWDDQAPVTSPTPGIFASSWSRPGKLLAIVTNWGDDAKAVVRFDASRLADALGDPDGWTASEPESGQVLTPNARGEVELTIPRHHYRYVSIERQ